MLHTLTLPQPACIPPSHLPHLNGAQLGLPHRQRRCLLLCLDLQLAHTHLGGSKLLGAPVQ